MYFLFSYFNLMRLLLKSLDVFVALLFVLSYPLNQFFVGTLQLSLDTIKCIFKLCLVFLQILNVFRQLFDMGLKLVNLRLKLTFCLSFFVPEQY